MLQNPNFPGLRPGPRWGSLQRSPTVPHPLTDGEGAQYPRQEPHPALGPSGLVSTGLVMKGLMGAMPPQNLWARTATAGSVSVQCPPFA